MDVRDLATWLQDRLDKIETKVDGVQDHTRQIDVTLAKQAVDLEHHIRRTDLLEQQVGTVAASIKPVQEHVAKLKGAWFLVTATGTGVGVVLGVMKLLGV